jgi:hypothetical protein
VSRIAELVAIDAGHELEVSGNRSAFSGQCPNNEGAVIE